MIRAYAEEYVDCAQIILGEAFDCAVHALGMKLEDFTELFLVSGTARQFACGNPAFVAGSNGCELVRKVLDASGLQYQEFEDELLLDKSPEYWAGWALAYYQWFSGRSFRIIFETVPLSLVIAKYQVFHEMDITQFADFMEEQIRISKAETRLAYYRKALGLSQSELSRRSGVPIRQIQLFEQRQRDINKTQAASLEQLSRALFCDAEELMEPCPKRGKKHEDNRFDTRDTYWHDGLPGGSGDFAGGSVYT